jgi:hypothetical protein
VCVCVCMHTCDGKMEEKELFSVNIEPETIMLDLSNEL